MMSSLRTLAACLSLALAGAPLAVAQPRTPAADPQIGELTYVVQAGDTLGSIATRLLRPELTWRHLRAVNQMVEQDRLRPGQSLRVPRSWLREDDLVLQVRSVSGQALADDRALAADGRLAAGARIRTGPTGVVVVALPDGTTLRVAPESRVHVLRLQRARGSGRIDARFDVEQGEVTVDAPPGAAPGGRHIELRTPKAVAAVRGTRFRVRESDTRAASEVLRGRVAWQGRDTERALDQGFGSSAASDGRTTDPEPLLPAPRLPEPAAAFDQTERSLRFSPVDGAAAYRVLVSRDEQALQAVREQVLVTNAFTFVSPEDGPFYIHLRAISRNGIEGYGATQRIEFQARPLPPALDPGADPADGEGRVQLRWPRSEGAVAWRLQVDDDPGFETPARELTLDEPTHALATTTLADGPGTWYWRVAGVGGDGRPGPYSAVRSIERRTTGPGVEAAVSVDVVRLQWQAPAAGVPRLRIDPLTAGASPLREQSGMGTSASLTDLAPGRYSASVIVGHSNGRDSAPGPAAQFEIPLLLRDGSGRPVLGAGAPIRMATPW